MNRVGHVYRDDASHRSATDSHRPSRETKGVAMVDNRPEAIARRQLADAIDHSPYMVAQRQQLRGMFGEAAQLQVGPEEEELLQGKFASVQSKETAAQFEPDPVPRKNNTGLPDHLKAGIESLSGLSMDNVRVHYNSSQPAQLNALAYALGRDIHVAPGQEQHLQHEAWHVVQQAQGRVQPTMQMKDGVPVNADSGLEHEADVMGAKAAAMHAHAMADVAVPSKSAEGLLNVKAGEGSGSAGVIQPKLLFRGVVYGKGDEALLSGQRLANGKRLPGWNPEQLGHAQLYTLNAQEIEWVRDERVNFYRHPTKGDRVHRLTGVSDPGDVDFDKNRAGPTYGDYKLVSKATLIKSVSKMEQSQWHWVLECQVEKDPLGKKRKEPKLLTMDVQSTHGYRAYYGPESKVSKSTRDAEVEKVPFTLKIPTPVTAVYQAMLDVAKEQGDFGGELGTHKYNCQDFILALLEKLDVKEKDAVGDLRMWRTNQKLDAMIEDEFTRLRTVL